MKSIYLIVALLSAASCSSSAQTAAAAAPLSAKNLAFVSQCKYSNNVRITLIYRFGSDAYNFVISDGKESEVSRITPIDDQNLDIETNGGIGKMVAIGTLFRSLLTGPFHSVGPSGLNAEMARPDVTRCPGAYPFSP